MSENASNATSNLDTLRSHLFDTLADLRNKESPMDLDRARAIAEVGQTIVNTAIVEVNFLKVTGQSGGSKFLDTSATAAKGLPNGTSQPEAGRTVHKLR